MDAPAEGSPEARLRAQPDGPAPIDPQNWENPDHMTWSDYQPSRARTGPTPATKGSVRTFKGALVLLDYPEPAFVVTQPKGSTVFGNPSAEANGVPRDQVAEVLQGLPQHARTRSTAGHTLHEYWMEDSGGRYGVDLTAFGPYRMPGKSHEYAMEFQGGTACPAGDNCNEEHPHRRPRGVGGRRRRRRAGVRFVFFLSAGQDESSTWQEFGR